VERGLSRPLYHRIETTTQPANIVSIQRKSGRIRGYPALGSLIPKVKAYEGPLPAGQKGIEFTTDVPPDDGGAPGRPTWSGARQGIMSGVDDQGRDFVEIMVEITKHV
jgi:hypothetical protein